MSMQFASVIVPRPIATPRGAEWMSELAVSLVQMGRKVLPALEAAREARAQRELRRLADRDANDTELARALRVAMILGCGNRG